MDTSRVVAGPDNAELLSQQATGLLAGVDRSTELLIAAPEAQRDELKSLCQKPTCPIDQASCSRRKAHSILLMI